MAALQIAAAAGDAPRPGCGHAGGHVGEMGTMQPSTADVGCLKAHPPPCTGRASHAATTSTQNTPALSRGCQYGMNRQAIASQPSPASSASASGDVDVSSGSARVATTSASAPTATWPSA